MMESCDLRVTRPICIEDSCYLPVINGKGCNEQYGSWILFPGVQTLQRLNNVQWNLSRWLHHLWSTSKGSQIPMLIFDGASRQLLMKTQGSLALGNGVICLLMKRVSCEYPTTRAAPQALHWKLHRMHFPFNPIITTAKSATFNYRGHRLNTRLLPSVYSALVHECYWLFYFYVIYSLFIESSCS